MLAKNYLCSYIQVTLIPVYLYIEKLIFLLAYIYTLLKSNLIALTYKQQFFFLLNVSSRGSVVQWYTSWPRRAQSPVRTRLSAKNILQNFL